MLKVILDAINEIKDLRQQAARSENGASKGKFKSLAYMNVLFLFVYTIPIIYSFIVIGGVFFYGPIVLLGLVFSIPFTLLVFWIKTRVYPVMKSNLLNGNRLSQ